MPRRDNPSTVPPAPRAQFVLRLAAIILTALALVPSAAHLFELPHKLDLTQRQYFVVQRIYQGWDLWGVVLIGAMAANLALALTFRRRRAAFGFALLGFVLVAATLVIFFIWIYPANRATLNWTLAPGHWRQLRAQWEYSHAIDALLTFAALCSVTIAALRS